MESPNVDIPIYSLPEFLDFTTFGKIISVVSKKFGHCLASPLRKWEVRPDTCFSFLELVYLNRNVNAPQRGKCQRTRPRVILYDMVSICPGEAGVPLYVIPKDWLG